METVSLVSRTDALASPGGRHRAVDGLGQGLRTAPERWRAPELTGLAGEGPTHVRRPALMGVWITT
jgi:hypothetical protein